MRRNGEGPPALRQRAERPRTGTGSEAERSQPPPPMSPCPSPPARDEAAGEGQAEGQAEAASREEGGASSGPKRSWSSAEVSKASMSASASCRASSSKRVASLAAPPPPPPAATAAALEASTRLWLKACRSRGGKLCPSRRPGRVKPWVAPPVVLRAALRGGGEALAACASTVGTSKTGVV